MRNYAPVFSHPTYNYEIKPISIYVWHELGLGDNMFLTPIIRKLSNLFNEKITLFVPTPGLNSVREFYKNNPYIQKIIQVGDLDGEKDWDSLMDKYDRYIVFDNNWNDYAYSDIRQLAASKVGMTLKDSEMDLDYFPDPYIEIEEIPEKFVCLNPYITGIDRNWEKEKWQTLIDKLNNDGIYVVTIGKGTENIHYHNLDIKLGVNLCNKECQNDLSQTWHILNKSDFFVSFDCGIFILAGSTNTYIIQLGWYGDPYYHMPIRNGIRGYKYDYIGGECNAFCATDPKFDIRELGYIREKHLVQVCMLNKNWTCKPSADQVYNKIKELYEKNDL